MSADTPTPDVDPVTDEVVADVEQAHEDLAEAAESAEYPMAQRARRSRR